MLFLIFLIISPISPRSLIDEPDTTNDPNRPVNGVQAMAELDVEIPPEDKGLLYYIVVATFVTSTILSTALNAGFLLISVVFWKHFRNMTFFWLLTQLTLAVFIVSILNLVINVPATIFSLLTKDFVQSDLFKTMTYFIDLGNYVILFSNFVIAIQRFFVFFIPNKFENSFKSPFIFIWFSIIWTLSTLLVLIFYVQKCQYEYTSKSKYEFICQNQKTSLVNLPNPMGMRVLDISIQILIPIVNFLMYLAIILKISMIRASSMNKQELSILKQAVTIFIMFQISSTIFLFCQIFPFPSYIAFIVKRLINTALLLAATATPCFFFATTAESRKVFKSQTSGAFLSVSSNNRRPLQQANQRVLAG